jgi:hypothetical protein
VTPETLTVGAIVPGEEVPSWAATALEHLFAVEGVRPGPLVVAPDASAPAGSAAWRTYRSTLGGSLQSEVPEPLPAPLDGAERIEAAVGVDNHLVPDEAALEAIDAADLDVVLCLAPVRVPEALCALPTYGVWSYRHGDPTVGPGVPPCYWTVVEGDPVAEAVLRRETGRPDREVILRAGHFGTARYAWPATVDSVRAGSARFAAQVARDLLAGEPTGVDAEPTNPGPLRTPPGTASVLRFALAQGEAAVDLVNGGNSGWNIAVTDASIDAVAEEPDNADLSWFDLGTNRRFIADPFPACVDGDPYLFFEDYPYSEGKGVISYVRRDGPLDLEHTHTALERDCHLSYPYTFTHDGETYVTPESAEAGEVVLYRLDAPDEWTRVATLLDGPILDPTLVQHGDRWWLFCSRLDGQPNAALHVYHAPEPTGPWEPHANNPVKTDVRAGRPGGTPWHADGNLYRPAQYCVGKYGAGLSVVRVDHLTPTGYAETRLRTITPDPDDPYPDGRHTLATDGEVTVVDGNQWVMDPYHAYKRFEIAAGMARERYPLPWRR